jgi:hypothetical protein
LRAQYNGANLTGGTSKLLTKQIEQLGSQYDSLFDNLSEHFQQYDTLHTTFSDYFQKYECKLPSARYDGRKIKVCRSTHMIDPGKKDNRDVRFYDISNESDSLKFNRDKAVLEQWERVITNEKNAIDRIKLSIDQSQTQLDRLLSPEFGDMITVEVLSGNCSLRLPSFEENLFNELRQSTYVIPETATFFSLRTPTIVRSQNDEGAEFVGGHNVDRQHYVVEIDPSLPKGRFISVDGKLRISAADSDHVPEVTAGMARVVDADSETQAKAFSAAIATPSQESVGRLAALGIQSVPGMPPNAAEGTRVESPPLPAALLPLQGGNAIRIGRAENGHLYFEGIGSATAQRVTVYGAFGMPSIIEGRARGRPSIKVLLDSSLSARDVDAIIANYKNAGVQVQASGGGGGWRIPPVVDTASDLKDDQIIKAVEQEIERGATLDLEATQAYRNGRGAILLVTGFSIKQSNPISGEFVAERKQLGTFDAGIIERLRGILAAAFFQTTNRTEKQAPRVIDYLIEAKTGVNKERPDYELSGRLEITKGGLRFVLEFNKRRPAADS